MSDLLRAVDALLDQVRRERAETESRLEALNNEEKMLQARRRRLALQEADQIVNDVTEIANGKVAYTQIGARGVIKKAITEIIKEHPGITPAEIADFLERMDVPKRGASYRQTVYNALGPMRENGEVAVRDGRYSLV